MPSTPPDRTVSRAGSRGSVAEQPPVAWGLVILHCPTRHQVGRRIPLDTPIRVGRVAVDVDLALDDPRLSHAHATLQRAGLVFEINDVGSRNGTFVNGERVERRALGVGDIVRVGDTLLEFGPLSDAPMANNSSLIGGAPSLLAAIEVADRVAASDLPVLLLGETGTGKDVLARRVHARSGLRGDFVAVNCAALPRDLVESTLFGHKKGAFTGATADSEGFFAQADHGTLFLDEVGELPVQQQAKLLRVLECREYVPVGSSKVVHTSARVIAATNADLHAESVSGGFRADLFARLAGAVIRLPPLRERRGDILELAERFLCEQMPSKPLRFSANAAELLLLHPWPRNVRELRMMTQRLALLHAKDGELSRRDVAAALDAPPPRGAVAAALSRKPGGGVAPDRDELIARLTAFRGNVNRLAEQYGKDPKQIYRWLKQHDLDPAAFR